VPFTVMLAAGFVAVGVTVSAVVALATHTEYLVIPDPKAGLRLPEFTASPDKVESLDCDGTAARAKV